MVSQILDDLNEGKPILSRVVHKNDRGRVLDTGATGRSSPHWLRRLGPNMANSSNWSKSAIARYTATTSRLMIFPTLVCGCNLNTSSAAMSHCKRTTLTRLRTQDLSVAAGSDKLLLS